MFFRQLDEFVKRRDSLSFIHEFSETIVNVRAK